ncbi:hypothetical protein RDI58_035143 [Solanum bulbocastanum]|uniref:Large ribosomal subunit protein uL2 RNA-binding domain-containing protein n=1 Tax=Solanum bulbocastanum TaxID=147425 RepID=A0AAN8SEX0_SOLBU
MSYASIPFYRCVLLWNSFPDPIILFTFLPLFCICYLVVRSLIFRLTTWLIPLATSVGRPFVVEANGKAKAETARSTAESVELEAFAPMSMSADKLPVFVASSLDENILLGGQSQSPSWTSVLADWGTSRSESSVNEAQQNAPAAAVGVGAEILPFPLLQDPLRPGWRFSLKKKMEFALLSNGFSPESVLNERHKIRGVALYPYGRPLAGTTYQSSVEIIERLRPNSHMSLSSFQPSFLMSKTRSYAQILIGSGLFLTAMAIYLSLRVAPLDLLQGGNSRIPYVHVPAARMSILVYIVTAINTFFFLLTKHPLFLRSSGTGTEIGAFSTLFTLVTGGFRGKPMWGTFWVWDARLTSVFILFLIYLGALRFQKLSVEPAPISIRAGPIDIPIIKSSVNWWNTLHQPGSISRSGTSIHVPMPIPILSNFANSPFSTRILFVLETRSTRTEIKHWVELFFGVKVIAMNSHRLPGKSRRMGPIMGHTMHYRQYDPNRNAYICLIHYGDGERRYILHPRGAIIGDTILSGTEVPIKMGNALPLSAV